MADGNPRRVILWRDEGNYEIRLTRESGALASFCDDWVKVTGHEIPLGHYQQIRIHVVKVGAVRPVNPRQPERVDAVAERVEEDVRMRNENLTPPQPVPGRIDPRSDVMAEMTPEERDHFRQAAERQQRELQARDHRGILRVDHGSQVRMGQRDPNMEWANEEIARFDRRQAQERRAFLLHIEREIQMRQRPNDPRRPRYEGSDDHG